MTDVLTKGQRSYNMSKIRSKWTTPEKQVHNYLKGKKIKHKMHPDMEGHPDIILTDAKTVIFIDGCFWHKCPKCYKEPKSRRSFWLPKIERTVKKDIETNKNLRKNGCKIVRIWEHEINNRNFGSKIIDSYKVIR
jgi:DNA mismatch endonuclease, patch repair protein